MKESPSSSFWGRVATRRAATVIASTVAAAVAGGILLAEGQHEPGAPAIVLPRVAGTRVLAKEFGHGDAVLRFTTTPHARYEVVCRGPDGLSVLALQVPHCSETDSGGQTGVSDTLPRGNRGSFTVFIQTSSRVYWGFEAFTRPRMLLPPGS